MRRRLSVALATLGLLAGSVAVAAPAAADHIVGISPTSCNAGVFTFNLFGSIQTRRPTDVSVVAHAGGTVVATCHFKRLPKRAWNETLEELWVRPPVGTVEDVTGCVLADYAARPFANLGDWYGAGTATFRAGSKVTTVCTFDPSYFEGAPA